MKSLNNKIDSFCYRHPGFGIPRLMLYIVIGNVLVYVLGLMDTTGTFFNLLAFSPAMFLRGQVWRLITFALVPTTDGILWLAISLYFYYFIGSALEHEWGAGKFTIYYFSGLLLTAIFAIVWYLITRQSLSITAHYLNLSLFFAFATLWPEQRVLLFFFIPVKMKWLAWVDAALFLYEIVMRLSHGYVGYALVPVVAMLAYLVFCGGWLIDYFRPKAVKQRARAAGYTNAARQAKRAHLHDVSTRKCAVCGRTEADNPGLEFRYCSRCEGYHCFCIDHINNHIHFTQ